MTTAAQPVELAWGPGGAAGLAMNCDLLVVVDVLSFGTCVSIATSRGASVRPVAASGEEVRARQPRRTDQVSLSPQSMVGLAAGSAVDLMSPNGAATVAAAAGVEVVVASLRNASAVADWVRARRGRVGLVAAGERWPDGRMRAAYEDAVGAGAIASRLGVALAPQAAAAAAAFRSGESALRERLLSCRSGAALAAEGFADDVLLAAELDSDAAVPVLRDGVLTALA